MNETTDATAILAPIWKRKWLILAVGILVAGATYLYFKREPSVYSAKTQIYLNAGAEYEKVLNSTIGKSTISTTQLTNQVTLINSSAIADSVKKRLRSEHKAAKGKAKAKAVSGTDFITITAEAHTARAAAFLANAYAEAYVNRRRESYVREINAAVDRVRRQLRRIELAQLIALTSSKGKGKTSSNAATLQEASLSNKLNQLESDLSISSVQQIGIAKPKTAVLVAPTPKKNAIFGFVVAVVLAAFAAALIGRLDRRLGTLREVEGLFKTLILAAMPTVRRPIIRGEGGPRPARPLEEPLRRLHTSLALGEILEPNGSDPKRLRCILFLSADPGDGRSTLAANLALTQRDAGQRVALVEADLRRPVQARLLGLPSPYGLAEVLTGTLALEQALQVIEPAHAEAGAPSTVAGGGVATMVQPRPTGSLAVLASGAAVANPPALLASSRMAELLGTLADRYDYVLIDAPPLSVSDVMPLLPVVDAIVLVARVGHTRRVSAQRLAQLLERAATARVLGCVANDVPPGDIKRAGLADGYVAHDRRRKLIGR